MTQYHLKRCLKICNEKLDRNKTAGLLDLKEIYHSILLDTFIVDLELLS